MPKMTISISLGTIFKTIFALVLVYLLFILRDIVLVILTSVVLASAVEPAKKWFAKYKIPRIPAVLLVYLIVISILALVFSLFIPVLLDEAKGFFVSLPQYIESISLWNPLQTGAIPSGGDVVSRGLSAFSLKDIVTELTNFTEGFKGGFIQTASGVFGGVFSFFLIIILSFYFAVQENGIDDFLRIISPIKHREYVVGLWRRTQDKIGRWMQGQLLLVVLIGVLTYLGLTILGVKYAILLALLAGILEIIPIFGPVISAVPAVIVAFIGGISLAEPGLGSAITVILFYVLVQQFENHLIYPLVVSKVVGVPPIIVILALIIGYTLVGFLGIILAVPVAAAIMEFAHDVQKRDKLK